MNHPFCHPGHRAGIHSSLTKNRYEILQKQSLKTLIKKMDSGSVAQASHKATPGTAGMTKEKQDDKINNSKGLATKEE